MFSMSTHDVRVGDDESAVRGEHETERAAAGPDPVLDVAAWDADPPDPPVGAPRVQPPSGGVERQVLRAREAALAHALAALQRAALVPRRGHVGPVRVLRRHRSRREVPGTVQHDGEHDWR